MSCFRSYTLFINANTSDPCSRGVLLAGFFENQVPHCSMLDFKVLERNGMNILTTMGIVPVQEKEGWQDRMVESRDSDAPNTNYAGFQLESLWLPDLAICTDPRTTRRKANPWEDSWRHSRCSSLRLSASAPY